jgi:hypothetical protein
MSDDDSLRYHAEVMAQQEQEEAMSDTDKISAAMAKAFPAIEGAVKGKVNPAFRSKYADLSAVTDAIKPHLEPHGLCYRQVLGRDADGVTCETIIMHASGQSVGNGQTYVPVTKKDAHGYAAAYTYARRISLQAAFGVPAEDDDGNAAVGRQEARQAPAAPTDEHRAIRDIADACIALHAAAVKVHENTGETTGFWELHRAANKVQGEDRSVLWEMLAKHSAVRAAIKEYAGYARAEQQAKVPA